MNTVWDGQEYRILERLECEQGPEGGRWFKRGVNNKENSDTFEKNMDKGIEAGHSAVCRCGPVRTSLPKGKCSSQGPVLWAREPCPALADGRKRERSQGICRWNLKNYNFICFCLKKIIHPCGSKFKGFKVYVSGKSFFSPYMCLVLLPRVNHCYQFS